MNCPLFKKILIFSLILSFSIVLCEVRSNDTPRTAIQQKSVSKKPLKKKKTKVIGPKSAKKAQKKQDAKGRKLKKDSKKAVKEFQKHTLEIQAPEVRERIKQNRKNSDANYKAKKKNNASRSKKAGQKYR
jgi:uncharacterized membrane protein